MEEKNGFKEFLGSTAGKIGMIIVFYGITLLLLVGIPNIFPDSSFLAVILCVALGYFGWKALNRIQPNIFLIMPIGGWLVYFLVKGMLSVAIGVFVAPFVISKKIVEAIQNSN